MWRGEKGKAGKGGLDCLSFPSLSVTEPQPSPEVSIPGTTCRGQIKRDWGWGIGWGIGGNGGFGDQGRCHSLITIHVRWYITVSIEVRYGVRSIPSVNYPHASSFCFTVQVPAKKDR